MTNATANGHAAPTPTPTLLPQHLADLRKSGLLDESIAIGRFRSVYAKEASEILGWLWRNGPCLAIPFFAADGTPLDYVRLKPDRPRKDCKSGKPVKNESPKGKPNRVYFPPNTRAALADPAVPLLITEGEKKGAKADQEGFPCIGLVGVDGALKKHDKSNPTPPALHEDLAVVAWKGRVVYLAYDSDIATNHNVQEVEWRLAKVLLGHGAVVNVVQFPPGPKGEKGGLDDYLIAHEAAGLRGLIGTVAPASKPKDQRPEIVLETDKHVCVEKAIKALADCDRRLNLTGFSADDLLRLLDSETTQGLADPDDVPEPPDEAVTRPGDLWLLGKHRLLCGDSSQAADVDRLLDGAAVHLVNTDPPYKVKVEPRSNNAIAAGLSSFQGATHHQTLDAARHPEKAKATGKKLRAKDRPLINDFVSEQEFDRLLEAWFGNIARVLQPGRAFYVWGGYANCGNYPPVLKAAGLYFSQAVIWVKEHPVLTRKDFMGNHEWCFYGWREGAAHRFFGPANAPDVWSVKKVNPQSMIHLTEKPVELAARAMEYSSKPGENVLDLFGGSGSTLIAAEQTGRKAFLMELDALYCDVIVQRYEKFSGKKAERAALA
jgi:DNA modification methylase